MEEKFPWSLEYREAGKTLTFSAEMATGPGVSIIIYDEPDALSWQPPHRDRPLTRAESHPILVRVTASLLLLGIRPIWETMPVGAERTDWPVIHAEAQALLWRA